MRRGVIKDSDIKEYLEKYENEKEAIKRLVKDADIAEPIVESRITAALILGLSGWVLSTVENLQVKVAAMESSNKENMAQWKALSDLSDKVKRNEIEISVNQRLFQMLLDQNGIRINIKKETSKKSVEESEEVIEEFQEIYKKMPKTNRKDRIDAFKEDQIR